MKSHTTYLTFTTRKRQEFINITRQVEDAVEKSDISEGLQEWTERLAPKRKDYKHHATGEDNADAHLKRMLVKIIGE